MFKKVVSAIVAITLAASLAAVVIAQSKDAAQKIGVKKSRFVAVYTVSDDWKSKSLPEVPLDNHSEYVERLAKEKKLIAGGPFKDFTGAILIIQADTEAEAREIMMNDPLVKGQVVKAELHAWHVVIKGCID